ncbi:PREDICTED: retina and anterior neural fold homeobox protein 2-like [Galeopterus variegatus]|uniref:Retina and anterior neural fold homeobox protein 2-like n=1 Tax=Galeopterus variegatus TaxID=482537 RepID=A0ABM0SES4_GALVR|nr:PREDICTED: retina and anterior neural fold homeobox protein 2-like [Galeopterus variegatus]
MEEPRDLLVPPSSQVPQRRQRQERTVYSALELLELERKFEMNKYPTYQEVQALADRLHLKERQVQVWFKNRRAKLSRQQLQRPQGSSGRRRSKGRTAPTCPGVPAAPAPASL